MTATSSTDPMRPFVAVAARRYTIPIGIASLVFFPALAFAVPTSHTLDYVGFFVFGGLIAWFMYRQATVRATPSASGLAVRNLFSTTTVEWSQIVAVRLGTDRPWASLDLTDGDTLAVMAIQQADGDRAQREASRLAGLVEQHGMP